jgi:hypothetical protein
MLVDYANSCFIIIGQTVFPDRQYKKSINNDLQNTAQKTKKRSFCHDLLFLFFFWKLMTKPGIALIKTQILNLAHTTRFWDNLDQVLSTSKGCKAK